MAGGEALGPVIVTAISGAIVAIIVSARSSSASRETTTAVLLVDERKVRIECEQAVRELTERFHAEREALEADRDKERRRADLLEVRLSHFEGRNGGKDARNGH